MDFSVGLVALETSKVPQPFTNEAKVLGSLGLEGSGASFLFPSDLGALAVSEVELAAGAWLGLEAGAGAGAGAEVLFSAGAVGGAAVLVAGAGAGAGAGAAVGCFVVSTVAVAGVEEVGCLVGAAAVAKGTEGVTFEEGFPAVEGVADVVPPTILNTEFLTK